MQAWQAPPQQPGNFNGPPPPQMQMSEEGHLGPNGFPPGGFPPGPGSTTSTRVSAAPPPLMDQCEWRG